MDTALEVMSRERVAIRTRESGVTTSAWRVQFAKGAIVLVEVGKRTFYRGEGALLGAPQEKLAELWQSTLPQVPPEPDNPPLG
jgi:hypothetical protein